MKASSGSASPKRDLPHKQPKRQCNWTPLGFLPAPHPLAPRLFAALASSFVEGADFSALLDVLETFLVPALVRATCGFFVRHYRFILNIKTVSNQSNTQALHCFVAALASGTFATRIFNTASMVRKIFLNTLMPKSKHHLHPVDLS